MRNDAETSFLEQICLPFLRKAQNPDGGWGFHPGSQSRVEPTCWALQAIVSVADDESSAEQLTRAFRFLRAAQIEGGSWPAAPESKSGSWVTSLACFALRLDTESKDAIAAGLNWLCDDWPRDSSPWRRFLAKFSSETEIAPINHSYRGWGWTPRTSSWVEPTSFALLALEQAGDAVRAPTLNRRRELAMSLLLDRMCPGGGWNCGNPSVYGVDGERLVVPTAFALLALRGAPQRREIGESLDWLQRNVTSIQAAGSLAVARFCLAAFGREWPAHSAKFSDLYADGQFLDSVQVMSWTCIALSGKTWLAPAGIEIRS